MNPLFRIPIRWQLIIIVAIVALPAAGIIIYSGIQMRDSAINDARMETHRLVDRIASEQHILAASALQLVVAVSHLPEVRATDVAKVNLFLRNSLKVHPNFDLVFVADRTGTIWASSVPFASKITIYDRRYFKNALASGQLSSGEFQISRATFKPSFLLGYPFKNNQGETIGVVGVEIPLANYSDLLKRTHLPNRADVTLIDHNGIIMFCATAPDAHIGKQFNWALFKKMQEGPDEGTSLEVGIDGDSRQQEHYVSYQKLRLEGEQSPYMYVRVGIPVQSVLAHAEAETIRNLSLFIFVLALALFLAWLVGKYSIADRIALLKRASRTLAEGTLQIKVSDLVKGSELGELGESFDAMAQRLASRERFLNTIIVTEPECLKMLDADGRVQMMNPAGLKIIDAESFGQVNGQSIYPLITDEYRDAFVKLTNDVFQGVPGNLEFEAVGFKGRHVWLDTHAVPFRNEAGEIVSLLGITRDISARKQADQALLHREADLKKAQEIAKLGSWTYGMSDPFSWSDEMYRICGVSPETFTPTVNSFINLIHPDDRAAMEAWIAACAAGEKPGELEFRAIWPDGTVRFISGRCERVNDFMDRRIHLAGTAQDITERKQAEKALAESESAFRATFEQAAVGMARVAPDGRWLQVNQRLCDVVGYTRDDLLALTYQDMTHPDDLDADFGYMRQVLAGDINTYSKEMRFIRKDRSIVWINFTVGVVRDSAGEPAYSITIVEEITKRKQAEEELAEKQRLLEELNRSLEKRVADGVLDLRQKDQILISQGRQAAMGEMIGNIAHQWRQPLNTLGLIVQELLMTYGRPEFSKESLEANVKKAMGLILHMSRTIEDFSNYFKPEKERILFNVSQAVSKAISLVEPSFNILSINIEVMVIANTETNGYPNEYSQVLLNILLNCRDAFEMSDIDMQRVITITVFKENDKSVVTVADNAGGIPADVIDKIFDPYFSTKGPDKGTGIGLYMAKSIIERNMGGRLAARNTADGAEFRIEV